MKTRWYLLSGLLLTGMACALLWLQQPQSETSPAKIDLKDRMDLAIQQEVEMTKDPALGVVPRERLLAAQAYAQRLMNLPTRAAINNINWTERGPSNVSGRTRALLIDANDATHNTIWTGGVGGGLWKTTNMSAATPTWTVVNDLFDNLAVSSIAQDPSNTQVMYFGTGEGWYNADAIRGLGIWKSSDGGASWSRLSSTNTSTFYYVQKIVVTANGTVFACTRDGGLRRSTDGGSSWTAVLSNGVNGATTTRCADLEIAANGDLYAAMGIFSQDGIYKSTNGGTSWTKLTSGLPTSGYARIELACAPSNSSRLYALFHNSSTNDCLGIYRSSDGGATWTAGSNPSAYGMTNFARGQAWYDLIAAVDPNNADRVFIGGVDLLVSSNAGSNWTQVSQWYGGGGYPYVHADQHNIVFQNGSSSVAYFANDGGIFRTANANNGTSISFSFKGTNYNVTQFYAADLNPNSGSNEFLGGTQDNGTHRFVSAGMNATTEVTGGDGAFCHIDQNQPNIQVSSYVYNQYRITTNSWGSYVNANVSSSAGRFINPTDYDDVNNILYCCYSAGQFLRISGIGGTRTNTAFTVSQFGTGQVSCVKVSPNTPSTVYFGLGNGDVVRVTNANGSPVGAIIRDVTSGYVSSIEVEPGNENHILVSYSNYGVVSVWETTNGGSTWTSVEGNLPDMPIRWVMFAPGNADQAFVATELGVWTTDDLNGTATNWGPSNNGLANVRTDMLQKRSSDNTIVAATHGRGLYTTTYSASAPPTLAVSPTSLSFSSAAGSQSVSVSSNTSWTASTADSWITLSPSSGSGNASVSVSVSANTGSARSGSVTFTAGALTQTVTVSQAAFTPTLSVSPTSLSFSIASGSQNVSVSSNTSWTASTGDSWITLSPSNGTGNASVSVSVSANTGSARSGSVTFTAGALSQTVTVSQAAFTPSLSVSPTSLSFSDAAGSQSVSVSSNTSWTASTADSWITLSPSNGSGNASVSVSVSANTGSARSGSVTFTAGALTQTVTVSQAAFTPSLSVTPTSLSFSDAAGSQSVSVSSNTSWAASTADSWITLSPSSGSGNGSVSVSVSANTGSARSGSVTFTAGALTQTVTVSQAAFTPSLSVTPTSLSFSSASGSQSVSVSSNTSWTASTGDSWITLSPSNGSGNASVSVSVSANTGSARSGSVTFTAGALSQTVTVSQAAGAPSLTVSPGMLTFYNAASSQTIQVSSNVSWSVTDNRNWITVSPASSSGNGSITVTVQAYTGTSSRTGTVTISGGGFTRTVAVNQYGNNGANYATLPYYTGFESGAFDNYWTASSSGNAGRIRILNTDGPIGNYHVVMDQSSATNVTNRTDLRLNLAGQQNVQLTFSWREFNDETHSTDGVYISQNNGSNYTKVYDLTNGPNSYVTVNLNISQLAAQYNLSLTQTFIIRFQHYDNGPIPNDGIGIDEIYVSAGAGPGAVVSDDLLNELSGELENQSTLEMLRVAPNPFVDFFRLELPATGEVVQMLLTDMSGRIIARESVKADGQQIELGRNLAAGMYLLNLQSGEERRTIKLVRR